MISSGTRIGPFELAEPLTRLERTTLFRAVRADGDREPRVVAMRVANDVDDAAAVAEVRREYEALRMLDDTRIRRTFAFYAAHGAAALEWLEGPHLGELMKMADEHLVDFDVATRIDVLIEVAYALRHAHSATRGESPIVNARLSPRTVRFGADGRVVVVDFGLPPDAASPVLPPEAARGEFDTTSDQWLLGALAFELLAGEPLPMDERGPGADLDAVLVRVHRACPPMGRVVTRMLAADATQRYFPDAAMIREMLSAQRETPGVSRRVDVVRFAMRRVATSPPTRSILDRLGPRDGGGASPAAPAGAAPAAALPDKRAPAPTFGERRTQMLYSREQPVEEALVDDGASVPEVPADAIVVRNRRRTSAPVAPPAVAPPPPRPTVVEPGNSADWTMLALLCAMLVFGLTLVALRVMA